MHHYHASLNCLSLFIPLSTKPFEDEWQGKVLTRCILFLFTNSANSTLVKSCATLSDISISGSLSIEHRNFNWLMVLHDLGELTIEASIHLACESTIIIYLRLIQHNLHGILSKVNLAIPMDVTGCIIAGVFCCCWKFKILSPFALIVSSCLASIQNSRQGFLFWVAYWSYSVLSYIPKTTMNTLFIFP